MIQQRLMVMICYLPLQVALLLKLVDKALMLLPPCQAVLLLLLPAGLH
jgi:hypothetical protein